MDDGQVRSLCEQIACLEAELRELRGIRKALEGLKPLVECADSIKDIAAYLDELSECAIVLGENDRRIRVLVEKGP